jgi:transcription elongation factor GreA
MENIIQKTKIQIDQLETEVKKLAIQLDLERKESTREDNLSIYNELLDKKQYLEARLEKLKSSLIELERSQKSNSDILAMGMRAKVKINGSATRDMTFVSPAQADPGQGYISAESPIGKALLGQGVGFEACIKTPGGEQSFSILDIKLEIK